MRRTNSESSSQEIRRNPPREVRNAFKPQLSKQTNLRKEALVKQTQKQCLVRTDRSLTLETVLVTDLLTGIPNTPEGQTKENLDSVHNNNTETLTESEQTPEEQTKENLENTETLTENEQQLDLSENEENPEDEHSQYIDFQVDSSNQYWEETIPGYHTLQEHQHQFLANIRHLDQSVSDFVDLLDPFDYSHIEIKKTENRMITVDDMCKIATLINSLPSFDKSRDNHQFNEFIIKAKRIERQLNAEQKQYFIDTLSSKFSSEVRTHVRGQTYTSVEELESILRKVYLGKEIRGIKIAELNSCRQLTGETLQHYISRLLGLYNSIKELYDDEYDENESKILKKELEVQARQALKLGITNADIRHRIQTCGKHTLTELIAEANEALEIERYTENQDTLLNRLIQREKVKEEPVASVLHTRMEHDLTSQMKEILKEIAELKLKMSTEGSVQTTMNSPALPTPQMMTMSPQTAAFYPSGYSQIPPAHHYVYPQNTTQRYQERNFPSPGRRCHYCNRTGHLIRECRTRMATERRGTAFENQNASNQGNWQTYERNAARNGTTGNATNMTGNQGGPVCNPQTGTH